MKIITQDTEKILLNFLLAKIHTLDPDIIVVSCVLAPTCCQLCIY